MIRKLQEEDADEIAVLDGKLFPDVCWNEHTIQRELRIGWGLAAIENQQIVGYLIARFDNDIADIIRLGVVGIHRGKGIARSLLQEAIDKIAGRIVLFVKTDNTPAKRLYLSMGFLPISEAEGSAVLVREPE